MRLRERIIDIDVSHQCDHEQFQDLDQMSSNFSV